MFEYDQEIVSSLLERNGEFKTLYRQHSELKTKVRDAELGGEHRSRGKRKPLLAVSSRGLVGHRAARSLYGIERP